MNNKPFLLTACGFAASLLLSCTSPFDDAYPNLSHVEGRTRTIEPFDPKPFTKPEPVESTEPAPATLDLSLEECRVLALKYNLDLEVVLLDPTIARQSITEEEARHEALLFGDLTYAKTDSPTASALTGSQTESISSQAGVAIPLGTGGTVTAAVPLEEFQTDNSFALLNPAYTADLQFSISQPLLRNAGRRADTHAIRIAHYDTKISESQTKLEVMRILADVDRRYWQLYAARRELEVRKQQYDLALSLYERAKRRVEAGDAAEIEITRAESGSADLLQQIITAEGNRQDRERELKRFINKPGLTIDSLTVIVTTTPPDLVRYHLDPSALAKAALGKRMELLELEIELLKDSSTIGYLRNQALPLLNLDYTYGINGLGDSYDSAFNQTLRSDFVDHILRVRAEMPLGNEAAQSRVRRALYTRLQRIAGKAARELLVTEEVVDAVGAINTNWQRIMAAQRAVVLQRRTYEAEIRQNELGLRTTTDVLQAQADLANAQFNELSAVADYQIAQVDLAVATGTLLGATKVVWEPGKPPLDKEAR